ncbi:MAG TPA: 4Fe-4S binding protein [Candidatus Cryosericum sp.]|jgi:2-oxoacid:acceptor oxidoreductase delta subunit (pyruvate/2-ketoisovalerate family)
MSAKKNWQDLELGVILPPATSVGYKTGGWRVFRPVWDPSQCIHCMICVNYCPDMAIPIEKSEEGAVGKGGRVYKGTVRKETNFDYCKGCGICATECPSKCLTMIREEEAEQASCKL